MNMISQLRQRVRQNGQVTITAAEYDMLQTEWITRIGAEDMVDAEREACAKMVDHILKEGGGTYGDDMRKRSNV